MMDEKRFAAEISERIGYYKTCLTVRPGSSTVFIGVDVADRYATLEAKISPGQARAVAAELIALAEQVESEIAKDGDF